MDSTSLSISSNRSAKLTLSRSFAEPGIPAVYHDKCFLISRTPVNWKRAVCNKWVWLLSLLIVIADRALFVANGMEGSRVTVMTLLKQAGCVVTILAGRFLFKEKNTAHKLVCAAIIIAGIVIGVS